ncbi:MAG TPA: TIGR03557 family F420-dependent LLM class oxidoreductase [Candidatus Limnocylindrales bacterium]|jgi:G6PDH family F420-dependent oxidoreductase
MRIGYALSSEEHNPAELVRYAGLAEDAGFSFALISDHYHPWIDRQGQSSFVWGVLGAISQATEAIEVGTGVTCPTMRTHPAVIAHAAATAASLMPGRFFLGVGTGENLNEHILGGRWPDWEIRAEMLEEAVSIIRQLWSGSMVNHRGTHYNVRAARLYTLPDTPPPIHVAAGGAKAADLAARIGDGLIGTGPEPDVIKAFEHAGGRGPKYGQVTICWAETEREARRTALEWWPNAAIHGAASQELPNPGHFEELTSAVTEDQVAEAVSCGPEAGAHLAKIRAYRDAGYDRIYIHQVGPDQTGFMRFAERELLPALAGDLVTASR